MPVSDLVCVSAHPCSHDLSPLCSVSSVTRAMTRQSTHGRSDASSTYCHQQQHTAARSRHATLISPLLPMLTQLLALLFSSLFPRFRLSGLAPFSSRPDDPGHLQSLIKAGRFHFPNPQWSRVSTAAKDLVTRLLTVDPAKRLTIEGAERHPWMMAAAHKRKEAPEGDNAGAPEKRRMANAPANGAPATNGRPL